MTDLANGSHLDRDPVEEPDVRAALTRILESEAFARSKRAGSFLRFIVEETLAGRGDRLKAFSIAREVYGRDETFDPRSDTVVRVEAGRLRNRLSAYYEVDGHDDPVRIAVPKGGYSPIFDRNNRAASKANPEAVGFFSSLLEKPKRLALISGSAVTLAILMLLAGLVFYTQVKTVEPTEAADQSSKVFLAVLPLVTHGNDSMEDDWATGLVEALITDLTRLSGLSVMAHASLLNLDSQTADLSEIRQEFGATHALRGSLMREGNLVRINIQLIDVVSSTTIWADRMDAQMRDLSLLQNDLTKRLVNHLSIQISPEESVFFNQRHSSNPEALALYRQGLIVLMPPNDIERIIAARHMFQRVIEIDPEFGGGYAGKGFSHSVTALFFKTDTPDTELKQGINLALKAIEVDPDFGMGYVTLAFAYALSGRNGEALSNARRAISVQPGDAFTQFIYGMCLTLSGNPHEAVAPLTLAMRLDPAEPRTPYRNLLGIAHYLAEEYSTAARILEENLQVGGPTGPHMDVFRASAYVELGNEEKARSIFDNLVKSYPNFPVADWLSIWLEGNGSQVRTMNNLYRLGLPQK